MELKPGYKQTEVGVIPEDWEVVLLDSVSRRASGHTPDKAHPEYWGGDIKWVSLADSHRLDDLYINETTATITAKGIANSSANILPAGCCIVSRDAGVGKSAVLAEKMAVSQHFMAWHCGPSLNNHYLYFVLQAMKPELERIAIGNTIKTIGLPYFKSLRVPLPSIVEQQSIASALLDVDQLIRELAACIAKKRDIKQAAMQELLTGKRRLPGFEGEWERFHLADVAAIRNAKVVASSMPPDTKCIELECIGQGTGRLLTSSHAIGAATKYTFKRGDVLFGRLRAYLRKFWLASFDGICSTEIWPLIARDNRLSAGFLHLLVQSNGFVDAAGVSYGTHMPRSDWSVLMKFQLKLPPIPEQVAIATVLSDMDAELASLEARRDKTRAIKQAMMQELLTGRIRLR
jgi:type I restriction enzyme S subunit